MHKLFRHSLLAFLLLTAAVISALTAMRIAIHGREVEVPKLVGLSPTEAEQQALDSGLLIEVENRFHSPKIPLGRILSQFPEAGVKVRRGWRVRLAESLGPQQIVIPNVVGQSLRSAELNLRRSGLEPAEVGFITLPELPPDQVVSQSPLAGAVSASSPRVGLLVTTPPPAPEYVMPNVVGSSVAEASRLLIKAGIKVRPPQQSPGGAQLTPARGEASESPLALQPAALRESAPVAAQSPDPMALPKPAATGVVISQSPPAGTKLSSGSTVEVHVR